MAVEYGVIKKQLVSITYTIGQSVLFQGVGKYTPNLALDSLMGWTSSENRRQTHMVRLWNRIQSVENDRLPKTLMDWDGKLALEGRINWNWYFREIIYKYGLIPRAISGYMDQGRAILSKAEGRGQYCSPEVHIS